MNRGFVKLWRSSFDSGLIQNADAWQLFTWMLLKATHKERKQAVGPMIVELKKGQLVFGRKAASEELKTTERKIRTSLVLLEKLEIVTIQATNRFSVISIVNWDTYQHNDQQDDQQGDQVATSRRPAGDHKQEWKKERREEESIIISGDDKKHFDMKELNSLAVKHLGWNPVLTPGRAETMRPLISVFKDDVVRGFKAASSTGATSINYVVKAAINKSDPQQGDHRKLL